MKDFKQTFLIPAAVDEVFNALTNPLAIELWTGYPADMKPENGYEFSLWDGDIAGRNLEVVPGEKIVQEWYFGDNEVPSIVTILLTPEKSKTRVQLEHTNIPEENFEEFKSGWKEEYFGALHTFFKE